jgi:WhiB family redox-sensing transcriptional regulator
MDMVATGNWRVSAQCRNGDPDRLFVKGAKQQEARSICRGCPVLTQCLSYALDERVEFGVWGGMTERERRAMLKARPDIACWSSFLNEVVARRNAAATAAPAAAAGPAAVPVAAPVPVSRPVVVPLAPVAARRAVRPAPAALPKAA